jgi:hypothetical protein
MISMIRPTWSDQDDRPIGMLHPAMDRTSCTEATGEVPSGSTQRPIG